MSIYESLLNNSVDIYSRVPSTNSLGEKVYSWSVAYSSVKCRLVPVSARERVDLPGEFQKAQYRAYFLSSQAISISDRIKYNGDFYSIIDLYKDSEGYTQKAYITKL